MTNVLAHDAARLTWATNLAELERVNAALDAARDDEEIFGPLALDQLYALVALFTAPAPDAPALVRKLELFKEHDAWGFGQTPEIVDAFLGDARRLTGAGAGMTGAG